ncbi:MAG: hypothetical protein ABIH50_06670 [bacterium]
MISTADSLKANSGSNFQPLSNNSSRDLLSTLGERVHQGIERMNVAVNNQGETLDPSTVRKAISGMTGVQLPGTLHDFVV